MFARSLVSRFPVAAAAVVSGVSLGGGLALSADERASSSGTTAATTTTSPSTPSLRAKLSAPPRRSAILSPPAGLRAPLAPVRALSPAGLPGPSSQQRRAAAVRRLRRYTREEVAKRDGRDGSRVWVTFRDAVLDVTDFVPAHPGGAEFIMQAAGGSVDDLWAYWKYHFSSPRVPAFVRQYRIGTLSDWTPEDADAIPDAYEDEPVRSPEQRILLDQPRSSETLRSAMAREFLTSNEAFYVRNHAPVPQLGYDAASAIATHRASDAHKVELATDPSLGGDGITMSVGTLRAKYRQVTVTSVLQCAGNRAAQMIHEGGATGFTGTSFEHIDIGMIGNARWSGPRLSDVLDDLFPAVMRRARASEAEAARLHVVFEGVDGYSTSTPLSRVADRSADCLLALRMNGKALPPDHGFPIRALMPGIAGARNVKWITKITLSAEESGSGWNAYYYKDAVPAVTVHNRIDSEDSGFTGGSSSTTGSGGGDGSDADATTATTQEAPTKVSIQELPMQSLITEPDEMSSIRASAGGGVLVKGIAWGGGSGEPIVGVEVSADGGRTWTKARLLTDEGAADDAHKRWSWVRWQCDLRLSGPIPSVPGRRESLQLCCRAVDARGNAQPERMHKAGGYLNNAWHRVNVRAPWFLGTDEEGGLTPADE